MLSHNNNGRKRNPLMSTERNWGLFVLVWNEEKGKHDKQPMDVRTGHAPVPAQTFNSTYEEARRQYDLLIEYGEDVLLGYLPRAHSQYVGLDLDNSLDEGGYELDWCEAIVGDYEGPVEVTPSGVGLRIVMPRVDGDNKRCKVSDINDVGFYAYPGRAFTVPTPMAEAMQRGGIPRDDGLIDRLIARRGVADANKVLDHERHALEFEEKWDGHWFKDLSQADQERCVRGMLSKLPLSFVENRDEWTLISMCLHQLQMYVSWNVADHWHRWSRLSNQFNDRENDIQWGTYKTKGGATFFTLLYHACQNGFDRMEWMRKARAAKAKQQSHKNAETHLAQAARLRQMLKTGER